MRSSGEPREASVGIDLGTSNCRIRVAYRTGGSEPRIERPGRIMSENEKGVIPVSLRYKGAEVTAYGAYTPNVEHQGTRLVEAWKPAIGHFVHAPARPAPVMPQFLHCRTPGCDGLVFDYPLSAKRCMYCGELLALPEVPGQKGTDEVTEVTPEEAIAHSKVFLHKVWTDCKLYIEALQDPSLKIRIGIGHPVHWDEKICKPYLEALSESVFPAKIDLVPEPAAALYHHLINSGGQTVTFPSRVMVVDFGAGTLDYCITTANRVNGRVELQDTVYYGEDYGGRDFDTQLASYAAESLGSRLEDQDSAQWIAEARTWKERFSKVLWHNEEQRMFQKFILQDGFQGPQVELNRVIFERECRGLIDRFRVATENALLEAGLKPRDIKHVVITGGGGKWYFVKRQLEAIFGKDKLVPDDTPEDSICRGLAVAPMLAMRESGRMDDGPIVTGGITGGRSGKFEVKRLVGFLEDVDYPDQSWSIPDLEPRFFSGFPSRPGVVVLNNMHRHISLDHFSIRRMPDGSYMLELRPRRPTNDTHLNDRLVEAPVPIAGGDVIRIVDRKFRFKFAPPEA